jgi:hypothetical protein
MEHEPAKVLDVVDKDVRHYERTVVFIDATSVVYIMLVFFSAGAIGGASNNIALQVIYYTLLSTILILVGYIEWRKTKLLDFESRRYPRLLALTMVSTLSFAFLFWYYKPKQAFSTTVICQLILAPTNLLEYAFTTVHMHAQMNHGKDGLQKF